MTKVLTIIFASFAAPCMVYSQRMPHGHETSSLLLLFGLVLIACVVSAAVSRERIWR